MDEPRIIAQRYRLGRKLGEGGMGVVYEAEHVNTGRRLAVKLLEHRSKLPAEAVDRFKRESRAPAAIRHPNVVEVIDAGTEPDDTPYIVMELLEGETLDDVLRRDQVVQPGRLAGVMDQLLAGLDAMHAHGYVHRDLKPANIFLVDEPGGVLRVKLLDFGIAKALGEDSRTKSGYVIGTPAYMAPEQMRNARSATPRSDLWSVGVMLYECLAGHRPYRGETFGLLAAISGPAPHVPLSTAAPAVPPALGALVDRLLAKDPGQRPASALRVRDALLPLLASCPRVEPVPPPDEPAEGGAGAARRVLAIGDDDTQPSDEGAQAPWHESPAAPTAALGTADLQTVGGGPARGTSRVRWALAGAALLVAIGVIALRLREPTDARHHGGNGAPHAPVAEHTTSALADQRELAAFVNEWNGTVGPAQGTGSIDRFYADSVQFGLGTAPMTRAAVHQYWLNLGRTGGSFNVDPAQSTWVELPATLNAGVTAACVNLPFATGRVLRVRAHATEYRADRSPQVSCPHLEGVYLLDLRRANGALAICHEAWSLRDGICASCPAAPACANGGAQRP